MTSYSDGRQYTPTEMSGYSFTGMNVSWGPQEINRTVSFGDIYGAYTPQHFYWPGSVEEEVECLDIKNWKEYMENDPWTLIYYLKKI